MSWEGDILLFCENGHESVAPCVWGGSETVCPVCSGKILFDCTQDHTNGGEEEESANEQAMDRFRNRINQFFKRHPEVRRARLQDGLANLKEQLEVIQERIRLTESEIEQIGAKSPC